MGCLAGQDRPGLLRRLAWERKVGKGMVFGLAGGFTKPLKYVGYASYKPLPGGWDQFPGLGALWCRVLQHAAANSPVRSVSAPTWTPPMQLDRSTRG